MKKLKCYGWLMVCLLGLSACNLVNSNCEEDSSLTVLEWNIWHGGHSNGYPEQGCKNALGILKESNADVILMIETYGAANQVADKLGYYHRLISSNLSVYSRYPIIETYVFPDSIDTFKLGGVMIKKGDQKVRFFDTWLSCLPDMRLAPVEKGAEEVLAWEKRGNRDNEVQTILNTLQPYIEQADSIPIIMGGDFNVNSHLDWTEATKDMYNHGGIIMEWPVSKAMEKAGFTDSFRELNSDPVKTPGVSWRYGQGGAVAKTLKERARLSTRQDRIDYIYYLGKSLKAIHSEVNYAVIGEMLKYKNKEFFYPSDHGFVVTTFNFVK